MFPHVRERGRESGDGYFDAKPRPRRHQKSAERGLKSIVRESRCMPALVYVPSIDAKKGCLDMSIMRSRVFYFVT